MWEHADLHKQELNLMADKSHYNNSGNQAHKAIYVCGLVRGMRMEFLDPDWTLTKVTEERQKNWMPEISVKHVLQCYVDWRAKNCVGKPGGPTKFKGGRGRSGGAQSQENGRPRQNTFEDPPPLFLAARPFGN
jgi:hypothetical protein